MSGAGSQLHFRGALALPNDNEPSLIVDLRVEDEVVVITQDSELIGSWSVEDVNAERLNGQKFRLLLGEDEVIFHARDRLGFAYNGLNAIREAKERREQRKSKWWFEKLVDGEAAAPSPSDWVGKTVASLKNAVARTTTPRRQETDRPKRTPERETPRSAAPPTPKPAEPATPAAGEPSAVAETASTPTTEPASDEPWGIPPEPAAPARQSTSVRGGRHRGKPADHDDDVEADDPWAMVSDAVLRRDDVAASSGTTARGRKKRTKRDHVHEYEETRLPGGLVRRVCSCGEVVIRSID